MIWYSGSLALVSYIGLLVVYLLRRRRNCYDLDNQKWESFQLAGEIFFIGYCLHFLPYFFVEKTLFLHNYMPSLIYKILLLCYMVEHLYIICRDVLKSMWISVLYLTGTVVWIATIAYMFNVFLVLSYGTTKLSADNVAALRWKDTWDFILHKDLP